MAKDKLFHLIHSLSKGEKKFFTQYAHRHVIEADTVYLKLFGAIEAQEHYNEEKLLAVLGDDSYRKHLPTIKARLYNLVLKSLVIRKQEHSVHSKILELLGMVEVLCEKQLFAEALNYLFEARELAEDLIEVGELLLVTYRWEDIIVFSAQLFRHKFDDVKDHFEIRKRLADQLVRITDMRQLYYEMETLLKKGILTEADQKKLAHLLTRVEEYKYYQPETDWERRIYYSVNILGLRLAGDKAGALLYSEKIHALLKSCPEDFYQTEYLLAYSAMMVVQAAIEIGDERTAVQYVNYFKSSSPSGAQNKYFHFHAGFFTELMLLKFQKNVEACLALIAAFEKERKNYRVGFHRMNEYNNYQVIINFLISQKLYEKALRFVNLLLNDKHAEKEAGPYYNHAMIMNIVVHIELKNYDILESVIRQAEYYFKSRNSNVKFIKEIMKCFRKISDPNQDQRQMSIQLCEKVMELKKLPEEQLYVNAFLDSEWLQQKMKVGAMQW